MIVARVEHGETARQLEELARSFVRAATQVVHDGVEAAERSAKTTTYWNDKSGKTRGTIRGEVSASFGGKVTARGAARWLELGTGPHVIPGNPVLRFTVGSRVLFRRWVMHPGTTARPFMAEAALVGERAMHFSAEVRLAEFARSAR